METELMAKEIVNADLNDVKALLDKVIGKSDWTDVSRMGGLTNRTYKVEFSDDEKYVVRIPGEGTEEMIVRGDEKKSTTLACDLEIDARLLYFGDDGSKVTEFIDGAVTMSAETMKDPENIAKAAQIFKKLHTCGKSTGVPFEVFDMAAGYEKIIEDKNVAMFDDFAEIEAELMKIKAKVDTENDISKVPCHNDALCENWVLDKNGRMYLIDWEYAGMNDGYWDLADVAIEAGYPTELEMLFLEKYLGAKPEKKDIERYYANKLYVDYLWTLWAKARVPYDGQPMEDWACERYARLKDNLVVFKNI